jgi:hypothetical protein
MFTTLGTEYMKQQHEMAVCCATRKAQVRAALRARRAARREQGRRGTAGLRCR